MIPADNFPQFLEGRLRFAGLTARVSPMIQIRAEEYIALLRVAKVLAMRDPNAYIVETLRDVYESAIEVPKGDDL